MFDFVVFDFCVLCSTPPVQSKIASFSSLTLRSQRRMGYGFALSAEALLRRHGLTHLMERECSQKCVALICSLFLSPVSGCRQGSSPSRTPSHPIGRSFSRRASRCRSILASLLFTGIPPYP